MILRETTDIQSIMLTPSDNKVVSIDFVNQQSGAVDNYAVTEVYKKSYYIQINLVVDLKENNDYLLKAYNSNGDLVYSTIVYCTNQTITEYSINNGEYVQRSTDNEYIVYE